MWPHYYRDLQCILLKIHQYRVSILYRPGPDLFITNWVSGQNNKENKDDEIPSMKINVNVIDRTNDIPNCMTTQEIQQATIKDSYLQQLRQHIMRGWPESRNEVLQKIKVVLVIQR